MYKSPSIHRTPRYRAKAAYANMKRRCGNKCGTEPAYAKVKLKMTLEEWMEWALPRYERFTRKYPDDIPNVSRKGDKGHYEIGNIRIVSHLVNRADRTIGQMVNGRKRCSSCKTRKGAEHFNRNRTSKDGYASECRNCRKLKYHKKK